MMASLTPMMEMLHISFASIDLSCNLIIVLSIARFSIGNIAADIIFDKPLVCALKTVLLYAIVMLEIHVFKIRSTLFDIIPCTRSGLPIIFPNDISTDVKSNARTPRTSLELQTEKREDLLARG